MWQALGSGELRLTDSPPEVQEYPETAREPNLALEKTGWLGQLSSRFMFLVRGPAPPKKFLGDPYFRDCWIDQRFPKSAFVFAIVLQALLILFPPPIWNIRPTRTVSAAPETEITWYDPAKDFPETLPAMRAPRADIRKDEPTPRPHRGADAFHPRQTILSEPLPPHNPRPPL